MNFVLIQFLARSGLEIVLVLVHIVVLHVSREPQQTQKKKLDGFSFSFGTLNGIRTMDKVEDKQPAEAREGLQQRRSYYNVVEHERVKDFQSVEMRREISSGQSSLKSQSSYASLRTESSWSKESFEDEAVPGQPINFGTVVPGVYRSSYPQEADYPFIQKLGLKTIITLVDKAIPETFLPFMKTNNIRHCHITMEGTKKQAIPVETMSAILEVIHDKRNHPVLIHCNQGRHRTGCVVAITRKLQKWNAERILDEYKSYAHPKIRDGDVEYISGFQVTDIQHLGLVPLGETMPVQNIQPRPRPVRLYAVAALIILVFVSLRKAVPVA